MKKILLVLLFACIPLFVGCAGSCVKVGGSYGDSGIVGEVEYCFSKDKSENSGVPTFESDIGDLFGFDRETISKIRDKLKEVTGLKTSGIKDKKAQNIHPAKEILQILGD